MRTSVLHLSSKSQTTIPTWIRDSLHVKPNMDIVAVELRPGDISLVGRHGGENPVDMLCGIMQGKGADHIDMVQSLLDDRKEDLKLEDRGFLK